MIRKENKLIEYAKYLQTEDGNVAGIGNITVK